MKSIILSTAYFPNIQYVSKFIHYDKIIIDIYENYSKQSYRNRCYILSSNGILPLFVPVCKNNHTYTKDIIIDYSYLWQKNHKTAILSAYKSSPYYDFLIDDFNFVFEAKEKFLIDLNMKILFKILNFLDIKTKVEYSSDFIKEIKNNFREKIHPKSQKNELDPDFISRPYFQVFSDKFQFYENLSILDLLFMDGKEAIDFL
ncbi:MAG: WbqC family protein [Bacteroidales bacterium]|jgi:hypothetical protein|nr:WbqC family protein [Bacteroidales bacterium]